MKQLRITYKKSAIGYNHDQRRTLASLGLRRLNQSVLRSDSPTIRGMINKVSHLVVVEEVEEAKA